MCRGQDRPGTGYERLPVLRPAGGGRQERTFPTTNGDGEPAMTDGPISRRAALRGIGATVALPFLESLLPRSLAGVAPDPVRPPRRLAVIYVPNGAIMQDWTPAAEGAGFELPDI